MSEYYRKFEINKAVEQIIRRQNENTGIYNNTVNLILKLEFAMLPLKAEYTSSELLKKFFSTTIHRNYKNTFSCSCGNYNVPEKVRFLFQIIIQVENMN